MDHSLFIGIEDFFSPGEGGDHQQKRRAGEMKVGDHMINHLKS
jgi:hypothetical protein